MTDMLVKLYDHALTSARSSLAKKDVTVKQALTLDRNTICEFIEEQFSDVCPRWVDECTSSLYRNPTTCFIAVHNHKVIGFCCHDATAKGMLGPLGVHREFRGGGIARELLYQSFEAMKYAGYAYAIIGWVSSEEYYVKVCNAMTIPDSSPGVYSRLVSE